MPLKHCPNCARTVIPTAAGLCPGCHCSLDGAQDVEVETEANQTKAESLSLRLDKRTGTMECIPDGWCSWNYRVSGNGIYAYISYEWASESGALRERGTSLKVEKEGMLKPRWKLVRESTCVAEAKKVSALGREFLIIADGRQLRLTPTAVLERTMELSGKGYKTTYRPQHAFTRRAEIVGAWSDNKVMLFGFWLTVLMWRRSSGPKGSGG